MFIITINSSWKRLVVVSGAKYFALLRAQSLPRRDFSFLGRMLFLNKLIRKEGENAKDQSQLEKNGTR